MIESASKLRVRPVEPHQADEIDESALLDFSHQDSITGILEQLQQLKKKGVPLTTRSGQELNAQDAARAITEVIDVAWEMRSQKTQKIGLSAMPDDHVINQLLASRGITSSGGLRDAATVAIRRLDSLDSEYLDTKDRVLNEGRHAPLWTMPEEEFASLYPRDHYSPEMMDTLTGDAHQAALRWTEMETAQARGQQQRAIEMRQASINEFRESIKEREWNVRSVALPTVADESVLEQATQKARQGRRDFDANQGKPRSSGQPMDSVGQLRSYSLAQDIQRAFTDQGESKKKTVLPAINYVQEGRQTNDRQSYAARAVSFPIDENGHDIRLVILSGIEHTEAYGDWEAAANLRGVAIDSIGGFSLTGTERPVSPEERKMFDAAVEKIAQAEQRVKAELGINLNIMPHLERFLLGGE